MAHLINSSQISGGVIFRGYMRMRRMSASFVRGSSVDWGRRVQCASDENGIRWWRRSRIDRSRGVWEREKEHRRLRDGGIGIGSLSGRRTGTLLFCVYAHANDREITKRDKKGDEERERDKERACDKPRVKHGSRRNADSSSTTVTKWSSSFVLSGRAQGRPTTTTTTERSRSRRRIVLVW